MSFTLQRYEFFSKSQHDRFAGVELDGCRLPCKGTNFLANHNTRLVLINELGMSFTLQRYEFFSKSQLVDHERLRQLDVVYLAKVRIF